MDDLPTPNWIWCEYGTVWIGTALLPTHFTGSILDTFPADKSGQNQTGNVKQRPASVTNKKFTALLRNKKNNNTSALQLFISHWSSLAKPNLLPDFHTTAPKTRHCLHLSKRHQHRWISRLFCYSPDDSRRLAVNTGQCSCDQGRLQHQLMWHSCVR